MVPAFTRAIYRRDRYGQFRDMLEQRALTAFEPFTFQIPNTRDLQGGEPQTVTTLDQPVTVQFKKTNATGVGDELRVELLDSEDFTKIAPITELLEIEEQSGIRAVTWIGSLG